MRHRTPWTPTDDALLGTESDAVIAKCLERTKAAVHCRRMELGIPSTTIGGRNKWRRQWGMAELALIGRYPDEEVATITGRTIEKVRAKRAELDSSK
jgi:hypothetical protein